MTIQMELRPCIVKGIYGKTGMEERKALFHKFTDSRLAIVEFESGYAGVTDTTNIRFLDNKFCEYDFKED